MLECSRTAKEQLRPVVRDREQPCSGLTGFVMICGWLRRLLEFEVQGTIQCLTSRRMSWFLQTPLQGKRRLSLNSRIKMRVAQVRNGKVV